jgi:peptidoglycan/xylan/chitin deacetylase (PgdA/CDA1 family)
MRAERDELHTQDGTLPLRNPSERRASLRTIQHRVKRLPHDQAEALVERVCQSLGAAPCHRKTVLSWDELRHLSRSGFTIAAHSRSHAILTRVPLPQVRDEAHAARLDLERELGDVAPVFCYPNGGHDDDVVAAVRDQGYRLAFTADDGENDLAIDDPMRLRRTNITPRTSGAIFRLRMTRWGARFDRWRHRGID